MNGMIGITRKDCDCIEQIDESLKSSSSGYYLHELSGVEEIETVQDIVKCENLTEYYQTLLENASRETSDDLTAQITERYSRKESDFIGVLGSRSHSKSINVSGDYIGLKLVPEKRSDGVLYIKSVGIAFNKTLTFDAKIIRFYKETEMIEEVDTIEGLNSTMNAFVDNTLDAPIKLPLSIQGEGQIEYYIVIPRTEDVLPRNNGSSCGCGRKERKLLSMVQFWGVQGNDLDSVDTWSSNSNYVNGIVLNAEIRCDSESFICSMNDHNQGWSKYFAQALLYKTAWKLHKEILSSNELTQAVLMDRETVANNMTEFENEYWSRIRYLVQNMDMNLTTCYTCNDRRLKVSQILT